MIKIKYCSLRIILFFGLVTLYSCSSGLKDNQAAQEKVFENPPAEGFDLEGSDAKAIAIADSVMWAMGGRNFWDQTQFIRWNFFGSRTLLWDKHKQLVRIESLKDDYKAIVNLEKPFGYVQINDQIITQTDSVTKYLEKARNIWINDAYWLVMPYKLKDSGVTLKYIGEGATEKGEAAHILEMQFKGVGKTPENKYKVWVTKNDNLVKQWSFYTNADDPEANFTTPWENYKMHKNIMLSGYRGPDYLLTEIQVFDTLPPIYRNAFLRFETE